MYTHIRKFCGKSVTLVLLLMFTVVVLSSCGQAENEKLDNPVVLRLAHFFSATHPAETELVAGWAEEIEEATNGLVTIESYEGGTLLSANDIYNGVISGTADIGLSCFAYNAGRFPTLEVFELPGIPYKNSTVASMVAWETIKQIDPDDVKETKLMMVLATGPGVLFTKKPVSCLEDLQGMTIRGTGLSTEIIKELGATPAAMDQGQAYEALQKNMVDGNLAPIEVLKDWNHADFCKHITRAPGLYNTLFYVTMNLDTWNSLPSDIQETILDINEDYQVNVAAGLWDRKNADALDWAINEKGIQVIDLPEDEVSRWTALVETIQKSKAGANDKVDAELLELVKSLTDEYNEMY